MAGNDEKKTPLAEAQRRAATMANRKPVSPIQFLTEALEELRKTTWPTKAVLTKSMTIVMGLVLFVALWVGLIDWVSTQVFGKLFGSS